MSKFVAKFLLLAFLFGLLPAQALAQNADIEVSPSEYLAQTHPNTYTYNNTTHRVKSEFLTKYFSTDIL